MRLGILVVGAVATLSGCAMKIPVAVISEKGEIMRGVNDVSLAGGSFSVAGKLNGKATTCAGSYNALDASVTISMPVHCSDGRKGIVIATRESSGVDGSGRVRLNDGTSADFVFGKAAKAF